MKRKWLIAAGFTLLVAVLIWANLRQNKPTVATTSGPKSAPMVKVTTIKPRTMTQTVLAPGTLDVASPREIRAQFPTARVHLLVGLGDQVKAGQTIAELDSTELRLQVANQEAAVARAEAAMAQLQQQKESSPLQLAQRVAAAKAQVVQAEDALQAASRQSASAQQRLDQAQANLQAVETRAAAGDSGATAARDRLESAEAAYRADPLNPTTKQAYDAARQAYADSLKQAGTGAKQTVADLAQASRSMEIAQQDLADSQGPDAPATAQARAAVESARSALALAQQEAENGGGILEQLRSAEADLAAARATLDSLRQKLAAAVITAAEPGVVLSLDLKDGQPAQQGQLIAVIGSQDQLTVEARVDEVDVTKVKPNQSFTVQVNAYPSERFSGQVTRVAAQPSAPNPGTGASAGTLYQVDGNVPNADGRLRAGMNAQVRILTETRSNAIVVGLESVREEAEKASVLVVKDFKVEVRPVKLGLRTQTQVQILEGLREGDRVIVSPFTLIRSLKDGDAVRVDPNEPELREDEQ